MSEKEKVVGMDAESPKEGRLYKPSVGEDALDPPHDLRSKAPAVPWTGTAENALKEKSEESCPTNSTKQSLIKKISSALTTVSSSEMIAMATIETDPRKQSGPTQPIPAAQSMEEVESRKSIKLDLRETESLEEESAEVVSSPDVAAGHSGWSDEEPAGRLPRSHSLTSRFSTAVRQLFCCGVRAEAPSEDDISYHKHYAT